MTETELNRTKDISLAFIEWLDENTYESFKERILFVTNEVMSLPDLFDYFIHETLTEILIEKL